jgi:hypothetical protein
MDDPIGDGRGPDTVVAGSQETVGGIDAAGCDPAVGAAAGVTQGGEGPVVTADVVPLPHPLPAVAVRVKASDPATSRSRR